MLNVANPSPTSVTSPPTCSTKCTHPLDDDDPTPITIPGSDPLDSPSIHTSSCFHQSKLLLKFPSSIMSTVTNPSPTSVTSPPICSTKHTCPLDDDDPTPVTIPSLGLLLM